MKKKKEISLLHALIIEGLILCIVCAAFLWAETRIAQKSAEKRLRETAESIETAYISSLEDVNEISDLYERAMQAKVNSLVYYIDNAQSFSAEEIDSLCDVYGVDKIFVEKNWVEPEIGPYEFYTGTTADGRTVAIQQSTSIINELTSEASIGNKLFSLERGKDFYVIFASKNGYIIASTDETLGPDTGLKKITEFGIDYEAIDYQRGRWYTINGTRYYTFSYNEPGSIWITMVGIKYTDMIGNVRTAVLFLLAIIGLIFTVLVTFGYFWRQERRISEVPADEEKAAKIKMRLMVYAIAGLVTIGLVTYYVQSLYSLSLHSVDIKEDQQEVIANLERSGISGERLKSIYNREYLSQAKAVSHILSAAPQLRTRENLAELSRIFGLEYIMMFDENGMEVLSDSPIFGFVISDDPNSQSYTFNVLKYGVSYVVQDPQADDLTGEYHQFIGVPTTDVNGKYDGFLQICVSPEGLQTALDDISFEKILYRAVSDCQDEILAIDKTTGKVAVYSGNESLQGLDASSIGLKQDQIRSGLFGYIKVNSVQYFADSFEINDHFVYITADRGVLFTGRITMTIFTVLVSILCMIAYTLYFNSKEVMLPSTERPADLYVDVTTAEGLSKKSINIITRLIKSQIRFADKTPEEKVLYIFRLIVLLIGLGMAVAYMLRGILYDDDSIIGFILSKNWNRGINVFALTDVLIFLSMYTLVMTLIGKLLDLFIMVSDPKTET
ncbi:MAG: cache domain-containing protein, partial [Erysipelotrichaceae bacterium]|nr:cache domain-containing protein [Erysipelotrichaceae bacterium]